MKTKVAILRSFFSVNGGISRYIYFWCTEQYMHRGPTKGKRHIPFAAARRWAVGPTRGAHGRSRPHTKIGEGISRRRWITTVGSHTPRWSNPLHAPPVLYPCFFKAKLVIATCAKTYMFIDENWEDTDIYNAPIISVFISFKLIRQRIWLAHIRKKYELYRIQIMIENDTKINISLNMKTT